MTVAALDEYLLAQSDRTVPRLALRQREAAAALGISVRQLGDWTTAGMIPVKRVGTRAVLYPVDALKAWLSTGVVGGSEKEELVKAGR